MNFSCRPPFPKKKIFGITNDSPENIEKRREELERYFNEIFNSKEVLHSDAIRYFIEESRKQAQRDKELEALNRKKKWFLSSFIEIKLYRYKSISSSSLDELGVESWKVFNKGLWALSILKNHLWRWKRVFFQGIFGYRWEMGFVFVFFLRRWPFVKNLENIFVL